MASNGKPQLLRQIFSLRSNGAAGEAVNASVRQDKARISSARTGTKQPASHANAARAHPLNTAATRSKKKPIPKRQTVQLTLWVDPIVKQELQRLAAQEGLTISKTGAAYLKQALQHTVDMQYSALLDPIIKTSVEKHIDSGFNRLAWLLVRVAFASEQTRTIATNILGRQDNMTEEMLKHILAMTKRAAQGTLTRRSPELSELITAMQQSVDDQANRERTTL